MLIRASPFINFFYPSGGLNVSKFAWPSGWTLTRGCLTFFYKQIAIVRD